MNGCELITNERRRQIEKKGWTSEHDDTHTGGELALAAVCYAAPRRIFIHETRHNGHAFTDPWPWWPGNDARFACGNNDRSNSPPRPGSYSDQERLDLLIKAGALIAAEIDRIQRAHHE